MMYLDHFGLRELPFRLTPLTEFFFSGAKRGATVDALIYAILQDEGIVKVSGEVGSGKTMLCRVLIERLPSSVDTVYFANPSLTPEDLLGTVAQELGLSVQGGTLGSLISAISHELIDRHGRGRRVVALIDEAHAMPAASLEQIRLLSNLETGRHKLLQLVLFGQPELDALLQQHHMRPLRERITHHFSLDPLTPNEVADYIDFRMRAAGFRGPTVFSPASARKIAQYAGGLSRRVNVLADKALLAAFAQNLHAVNPAHVKTAARDAQYLPRRTRRPGWFVVPAAFILSAALAWQAFSRIAPVDSPASTSELQPLAPDPLPVGAGPHGIEASNATDAPPTPDDQGQTVTPEPTPADPMPEARPAADRDTQPDTRQTAPSATAPVFAAPAPDPVAAAEADLKAWLANAPDDAWFIQLHTNNDLPETRLAEQVEQAQALIQGQPVRVYRAQLGAVERSGVIVGSFDDERAALAALNALPAAYRSGGAYVRRAKYLK